MRMMRNVMSFFAVAAMVMTVANATTYTVGDADGWSAGLVDYTAWASGITFKVRDQLVFNYLPNHDVLEVSKADYDICSASSPIESNAGGRTIITLTAPGKKYYICGTEGHCDQGQKLEVETMGSASSPPPPNAASPPPPKPATPPPSPPASPPPVATPPPATPPPVASPPPASPPPVATPPPKAQPPVATPPMTYTPKASPPKAQPPAATPPMAYTPKASPPTITPASPPPKTSTPDIAPTMSPPEADSPPPVVTPPSSAYKISYSSMFAFALIMLAAI